MSEKVVNDGIKIDLHIHSALSRHKDGTKVSDNTIENIDDLIASLNDNSVGMCSITDHDGFDFELYSRLKQEENKGCIKKVLPGVEFSVEYRHDSKLSQLHIVTIFDDSDNEKVKKIEDELNFLNGKPKYDCDNAFSEKRFLSILQNIDLNTVMIVHQKGSLLSKHSPEKHDANSLGEEKLSEFLFSEYFEAYEFKNRKNEIFSKKYIVDNDYQDLLRLITCSDCHSWKHYPKIDEFDMNEFEFTWLKCLPTFKGLVMSMTDHTRIKRNNSFFSVDSRKLSFIDIIESSRRIKVPLSKGINVIIGDNSIGKSLLLHKLTSYTFTQPSIRSAYEKYLLKNNLAIESSIKDDFLFQFDVQGGIREKFEKGNLNNSDLLKQYYPEELSVNHYTDIIDSEIVNYCKSLEKKVLYSIKLSNLGVIKLFIQDTKSESICLMNDMQVISTDIGKHNKAILKLSGIIRGLEDYLTEFKQLITDDEKTYLNLFIEKLNITKDRLMVRKKEIEFENKKINDISTLFIHKTEYLNKIKGDKDKESAEFQSSLETSKNAIVDLIRLKSSMSEFRPNVIETPIDPLVNEVFKYKFICKVGVDRVNNDYINSLLGKVHKSKWSEKNYSSLTANQIIESISNYPGDELDWCKVIKSKVREKYLLDFKYKSSILSSDEKDLTREMSSGKNMQIYFDLISYNSKHKGIYLVDQPEDSVSQKAIKEYLLGRFKIMSENRQVIIVTHNPQFIVNLDVDNVIFIARNEETGNIIIQSGALEYEGSDHSEERYNILEIVANNIDGGIETINRRWKRYDKNNNASI